MAEGTIGFFHDRKGYGFIERNDADDDAEDIFFTWKTWADPTSKKARKSVST